MAVLNYFAFMAKIIVAQRVKTKFHSPRYWKTLCLYLIYNQWCHYKGGVRTLGRVPSVVLTPIHSFKNVYGKGAYYKQKRDLANAISGDLGDVSGKAFSCSSTPIDDGALLKGK